MKHLFLIRHAKSSWENPNLSDRKRPLNPRGESQLEPLGRALQRLGVFSGDVFASDAVRAQQTANGIVPAAWPRDRCHTQPELYTFDYVRVLGWLKTVDDRHKHLVIIGHNPALLELAAYLVKHAPMEVPTASFIHIRLPVKHWRKLGKAAGTLETFLIPRDYSYQEFDRKHQKRASISGKSPQNDLPASLLHQSDRLKQLERGVMLGLDDEFLHQYRIAIRRSRAIAESIAEVSGKKTLRNHIAQLKRHAQATGPLRDLHVFLQDLPTMRPGNPELTAALDIWAKASIEQRQKKLGKRLISKRYRQSLQSWENEVESRHFRKFVAKLTPGDIRKAIEKRLKTFNRKTGELSQTAPDEDFHTLRKLLKRIRYLMELDPENWKQPLKTLRKWQDLYGRFQDLHVQLELLEAFGKQAPETLFTALNQLITQLQQEKVDTRQRILSQGGLKVR